VKRKVAWLWSQRDCPVPAGRLTPVMVEPALWLTDTEQQVWRRLLAVEFRLRERLDHDLRTSHGLSLNDYGVLVHLSEAPDGSLRMSDLADRLLISRSGLTRRVDGLVRNGWVIRRACPKDGRGSFAELTAAGLELLKESAPTHVAGVRRYLIDALGDLDGLSRGLAMVEEALE
jgi:DNA-binding MarR family transcriptional regulator